LNPPVVFVHPQDASCCGPTKFSYSKPIMDGSWIEWPMNTARAIVSLMTSGTLRRFPHIRFIFAHGGGLMPLLVSRLAGLSARGNVGKKGLASLFPNGVEAEVRTLHFECAQACSRTNMTALRSIVPDSHILYGSDFPFFPLAFGATNFAGLELPAATRRAIMHTNAGALLPRWA
jgi:predicted TIM-barrel fold metal-dependent hydrolase